MNLTRSIRREIRYVAESRQFRQHEPRASAEPSHDDYQDVRFHGEAAHHSDVVALARTHGRVSHRGAGGEHDGELLYWTNDWEHPPQLQFDPPLMFEAGEQVRLTTT